MRTERHTCPRRSPLQPWKGTTDNSVRWERTRWSRRRHWRDWLHALWAQWQVRWMGRPRDLIFSVAWPSGEPQPRTCSFCGSVHAEDAIHLLQRGWEVEPTGKGYKRYLRPPRGLTQPVPPVKLYTWHVSKDQADRFNAAIDAQARAAGPPTRARG